MAVQKSQLLHALTNAMKSDTYPVHKSRAEYKEVLPGFSVRAYLIPVVPYCILVELFSREDEPIMPFVHDFDLVVL